MNKNDISKYFAKLGAKGGSATGKSKARTPEQARAAVMARWKKAKKKGIK